MKILVLNSGSSSLKFKLFIMPGPQVLCSGRVERIGTNPGLFFLESDEKQIESEGDYPDHGSALREVLRVLMDGEKPLIASEDEIEIVGHRVVHGGEQFVQPVLIDEEVKSKIRELFSLAPLHNPPNYEGVVVAEKIFPNARQVAVFDTAFHATIPDYAYRMAIPSEWYTKYGIRNYGFHGTSHQFVSRRLYDELGESTGKVITIHLGNGCSMAAVKNGKCVDISMGLGPLSGLVMGSRPGDLDPSVIFHLIDIGVDVEEVRRQLNKESGMVGLTGFNDLRQIHQRADEGDEACKLALDIYAYRIKKYIGMYMAALGGIDGVAFTAGVGENDYRIRQQALEGLEPFGLAIDIDKNESSNRGLRSIHSGNVPVFVIPTDEEGEIARQAYELLVTD